MLKRKRTLEEGYETDANYRYLVRPDNVTHTIDIHKPDLEIVLRDPVEGGTTGVAAVLPYEFSK